MKVETFVTNAPTDKFFDVGYKDLLQFTGDGEQEQKMLVVNLLRLITGILAHPNFPLIVKNTKKAQQYLIQVWQRLLTLRAEIREEEDEEDDDKDDFFSVTQGTIVESMLSLQELVSLEHYLTITHVLIECTDGGDEVLVDRSLKLLRERLGKVKKSDGEYHLVIEFLRDDLLKALESGKDGPGVSVAMAALAVVVDGLIGVEEEVRRSG